MLDYLRILLNARLAKMDERSQAIQKSLDEAQAAALRKLTKNVFLLYDSDKAGLQATFRSGDELLRQGVSVRVVTLPDGEDPDTFVKGHGAAALTARLKDAIDVFERKIQLLERAGMFSELQKKRRALDRLLSEGWNAERTTCAEDRDPASLSACGRVARRRALFDGPFA